METVKFKSARDSYIDSLISLGYYYDCDGYNSSGISVECYRHKYTGEEIQVPKEYNHVKEFCNYLINEDISELINTLQNYSETNKTISTDDVIAALESFRKNYI